MGGTRPSGASGVPHKKRIRLTENMRTAFLHLALFTVARIQTDRMMHINALHRRRIQYSYSNVYARSKATKSNPGGHINHVEPLKGNHTRDNNPCIRSGSSDTWTDECQKQETKAGSTRVADLLISRMSQSSSVRFVKSKEGKVRVSGSRSSLVHCRGNGLDKDAIIIATRFIHGEATEISLLDVLSLGSCKRQVNDTDQRREHETY